MPCGCSDCKTATFFDERLARRELRKYRRAGPRETTKRLIELLRAAGAGGALLDIGCGTGILTFELLGAGFSSATCVDAAPASLAAGRAEAMRQGVGERITWTEGDFVELASSVPSVEVVTLDRVVCCYAAYRPLLEKAAAHGRRYVALVYPRDRWFVRLFLRLENLWLKLRGSEFRGYLHPPPAIDEVLRRSGLRAVGSGDSLAWEVRLYERNQP